MHPENSSAHEAILHVLHQTPVTTGLVRGRWTLALLLATCNWLRLKSLPGLSQLLHRLHIHWKRGRYHVHSPDENYIEKLRQVRIQLHRVPAEWEQMVFLFADEFTLYRHPSLAQTYEKAGRTQALAELGYKGNYTWRIAAGLNAWTGQVTYQHARVMDVTRLITFYRKLTLAYPGLRIEMAQDNWPVHYHPDLVAAMQPQLFPFGLYAPPNWSRTNRKVDHLQLPIHILSLPTYASWNNPIEKLWRLLKQDILHLHHYADDWPELKQRVFTFLDGFSTGSKDLLRYVGLEDPKQLYHALFPA